MVEVVQLPFRASVRGGTGGGQSLTLLRDWTTATSMVVLVLVCVRVRSGASAQLSGAY
jgi:hypothetical protein